MPKLERYGGGTAWRDCEAWTHPLQQARERAGKRYPVRNYTLAKKLASLSRPNSGKEAQRAAKVRNQLAIQRVSGLFRDSLDAAALPNGGTIH